MERFNRPTQAFPEITSIDQITDLLSGQTDTDFVKICNPTLGTVVFDYEQARSRTFPTVPADCSAEERSRLLLYRELRGIIFSKTRGVVLARRYHKFFNVDERPDTAQRLINLLQPHVLLEKLDGSLVSPIILDDGTLRYATKRGVTAMSDLIEKHLRQYQATHRLSGPLPGACPPDAEWLPKCPSDRRCDYFYFAQVWLGLGFSPLFEWCSPQNKLVMEFANDQLVLTAIRHHRFGHYLPYPLMVATAREFGIPCVRTLTEACCGDCPQDTGDEIERLMQLVRKQPEMEGIVLRFDDGTMYKIKTSWYLTRVRGKPNIANEAQMWCRYLEGSLDDLLGSIPEAVRLPIVRYFDAAWPQFAASAHRLVDEVRTAVRGGADRAVWLEAAKERPALILAIFEALWNHFAPPPAVSPSSPDQQQATPPVPSPSPSPSPAPSTTSEPVTLRVVSDALLRYLHRRQPDLDPLHALTGRVVWPIGRPVALASAKPRTAPRVGGAPARRKAEKEESLEDVLQGLELEETGGRQAGSKKGKQKAKHGPPATIGEVRLPEPPVATAAAVAAASAPAPPPAPAPKKKSGGGKKKPKPVHKERGFMVGM
ncbi:putative RNA ligase; T4 RnlA family protein [Paratrimastix pyriformis]|uniref:RNA ligase n=1 Tax=Paratrimastix pyriformis TaxID=342808 RepID=A0ABQ8UEM1_9EUKA|nr:putative RNA ligase; T4 RnlA family protein [Paratrimastix pyriformis]